MIRIIIADDHTLFRVGLRQMLHSFAGMEVIREVTNAAEALAAAKAGGAELIILDLSMPGATGTSLIEQTRKARPDLPILVLSMHDEPGTVRRALQAGASGYITKGSSPDTLFTAVSRVGAGERYIDPAIAESLAFDAAGNGNADPHRGLSPREWEVLQLIARGVMLNQIADQLHLSPKTVTTHKAHLMEKLGIANNADLIRYSIENKLFD
ncbi:response regulator transcription factor [Sulfuritalea sp.]|uniref:response regulator n=1 Tax=Sulfuritalea sp. TaxID=2480090 RepID=UPI001AD38990|nr:response regulator transcription factor [Sulfuritalea sp.]MBN8475071.1 response regulator transcription factor [Sulfuritalea sp.]